jgi:hypothetical protein
MIISHIISGGDIMKQQIDALIFEISRTDEFLRLQAIIKKINLNSDNKLLLEGLAKKQELLDSNNLPVQQTEKIMVELEKEKERLSRINIFKEYFRALSNFHKLMSEIIFNMDKEIKKLLSKSTSK